MKPQFWKLSQGAEFFSHEEVLSSLTDGLVYVHKDTRPPGGSNHSPGEDFVNAPTGNYFYLTHGNHGVFCLGQFSGPANIFSRRGAGWLDRPFRIIRMSNQSEKFEGAQKWWTPNFNSTFMRVPEEEVKLFEELLLKPFFDLSLIDFKVQVSIG